MDYTTLKSRIRDLVDDPAAEYTSDDYLQNKVAQVYDDLYDKLRMTGAQFDEQVLELLNVPAGTSDLSNYGLSGKPLELLLNPKIFEYKLAGLDPTNYVEARLTDRLRDVQANRFIESWEWRRGVIYFTPPSVAVDIRIRGEFLFSALSSDSDIILAGKNVGACLAYWTASLIGIVRGNPQWERSYQAKGDEAFDNLALMLVKSDQPKVRRVGRMSRRQRPRQSMNFR